LAHPKAHDPAYIRPSKKHVKLIKTCYVEVSSVQVSMVD
jgi:hypothetical protein